MKKLFVVCIALLALLTFACRGNDNQAAAQAAPVVEATEVVEVDYSEEEAVEEATEEESAE